MWYYEVLLVVDESYMYTLYMKPTCPFSARVLRAIEGYEFVIEQKDVTDSANAEELIEKGGKRQTPCLIDHDRDVVVYESNDIVSYLLANT